MRANSKLALIVALSVGLMSTAVFADPPVRVLSATVPSTVPGGNPTPSNPNTCTVLCPQPGLSEVSNQDCSDKLKQLRRVTASQVRRIDEQDVVHLVPLCDTVGHSLADTQTQYLARGNVSGLIPAIGTNPVLMAKLDTRGYAPNDVIGIALGVDAAILYVHHR